MISADNDLLSIYRREAEEIFQQNILSLEEVRELYQSEEYETYFVEYIGDFIGRINSTDFARALFINAFFAVLFVKKGRLREVLRGFPDITNIERSYPYILLNLEESNELPDLNAINIGNTSLDGTGVIVGIIGNGIDYLNPRFMDARGNTRIISIWDQSVDTGPIPKNFFNGTEYTSEDINRAIKSNVIGNNPYEIVNHKDETGYSTSIATIVGGRKLDETDPVVSVAPKCEFIVVKLKEGSRINRAQWGLEDYKGDVYDSIDIASAGRYLYEMQQRLNKPVVMYLSIGSNLGAHDGSTLGERYVDFFTQGRMFSVATSTGNQGGSPICYKSNFLNDEFEKVIDINIDNNQKNLFFSLYYSEPDRINVGIISPEGKIIDKIPIRYANGESINIRLGETSIFVQYFIEGRITGEQRLDFVIKNAVGGVWKVIITKDYSIHGKINLWLQQKEFSVGSTGLLHSTPYTTLMPPATSNNIIVTSSYNQLDKTLMADSGRGFTADNRMIPTVALPAKNILTVGLNNKPISITGSAVSGAILTGIVALLYQWGIVERNDLNLYSAKIKSYLIQGTIREEDKFYPNPETGFGVLSIEKLMERLSERQKEYDSEDLRLYINVPQEFYKKLKC